MPLKEVEPFCCLREQDTIGTYFDHFPERRYQDLSSNSLLLKINLSELGIIQLGIKTRMNSEVQQYRSQFREKLNFFYLPPCQ
jgi:hypothetical protein